MFFFLFHRKFASRLSPPFVSRDLSVGGMGTGEEFFRLFLAGAMRDIREKTLSRFLCVMHEKAKELMRRLWHWVIGER